VRSSRKRSRNAQRARGVRSCIAVVQHRHLGGGEAGLVARDLAPAAAGVFPRRRAVGRARWRVARCELAAPRGRARRCCRRGAPAR
jgi:hypothetical protein